MLDNSTSNTPKYSLLTREARNKINAEVDKVFTMRAKKWKPNKSAGKTTSFDLIGEKIFGTQEITSLIFNVDNKVQFTDFVALKIKSLLESKRNTLSYIYLGKNEGFKPFNPESVKNAIHTAIRNRVAQVAIFYGLNPDNLTNELKNWSFEPKTNTITNYLTVSSSSAPSLASVSSAASSASTVVKREPLSPKNSNLVNNGNLTRSRSTSNEGVSTDDSSDNSHAAKVRRIDTSGGLSTSR